MAIDFISTRKSKRIDYRDPAVIASRATKYQQEAIRRSSGYWIVGRFIRLQDRLTLAAVAEQPGRSLDDKAPLTVTMSRFYRWCTRQAARQWLIKRPHLSLALFNTETLWDPRCPADNAAADPTPIILAATRELAAVTTPPAASLQPEDTMQGRLEQLDPSLLTTLRRCLARDYPPLGRPYEIQQLLNAIDQIADDTYFAQHPDPKVPEQVLTPDEIRALATKRE